MYFSVRKTRMKRKNYLFNANNELPNGFAKMVVDITLFLFPLCERFGKMSGKDVYCLVTKCLDKECLVINAYLKCLDIKILFHKKILFFL